MKIIIINLIIVLTLSVGFASAGVFDDTVSLSSGGIVPSRLDALDLSLDSSLRFTNSVPFTSKILADTNLSSQILAPQADMIYSLQIYFASADVFDYRFSLSPGVVVPSKPDAFRLSLNPSLRFTNSFSFTSKVLGDANLSFQLSAPSSGMNYSLQIGRPSADRNYCLQIGKPNEETNYVIQVFR